MSWLYSRALAAEFSAATSSGGEPSVPSKSTPIAQVFCAPDKMTAFSRLSRFGMTCAPLTDARGEELLTWFRAGFPARTFPALDAEPESTVSEAGCGRKWPESLAKYDPDARGWKTRQCSLFGGLTVFSGTWPKWGMTRGGELYRLPTPALRTCGNGYGLWPTIRSTDGDRGGRGDLIQAVRGNENDHFKPWPTPKASPSGPDYARPNRAGAGGDDLATAVARETWPTPHGFSADGKSNGPSGNELGRAVNRSMFPTPRANKWGLPDSHGSTDAWETFPTPRNRDWKDTGTVPPSRQADKGKDSLGQHVARKTPGGSLNPTWVEWLMGWPLGWTDLKPLATDRFRQWCVSHGMRWDGKDEK